MKAVDFFKDYQDLFASDNLPILKEAWKNRDRFTKEIIPLIEKILKEHGYAEEHQREYYRIDVIGWYDRKQDLKKIVKPENYPLKEHFWELGVAIEHENDMLDWTDELVKLLYINCPLRIVIGYYPENAKEQLRQALEYASDVVSLTNVQNTLIRDDQEYVLILGENHQNPEQLNKNTYSAYIYNNLLKKFVPLIS